MTLVHTSRILLVEDEADDIRLMQEVLSTRARSPELHAIRSGEEAIAFLERAATQWELRPQLILLDLEMPGLNGFAVLDWIKGHPLLRSVPVIIFSNCDGLDEVHRAYGQRANGYVCKPASLQELSAMVDGLLGFWFGIAALPR